MAKRHRDVRQKELIESLCAWFDREARDLPWRRKRTGYAALVSEMMLQQTQVSRVVACYTRFVQRFPTVQSLARAKERDVLALWQGMGYYRRARNLHAAAKIIVREFAGVVPSSVADLLRLPGVGRYTAGAIASIVFQMPEPIVDGNVERVLMRVHARRPGRAKPPTRTDAKQRAWNWIAARNLVESAARPGVFNEAMMELGATICSPAPASPNCGACPIAQWCKARRLGLQNVIPTPMVRAIPQAVHHHAVIITRGRSNQILFEQRGDDGMWAGMWQTPTIESESPLDQSAIRTRLPVHVVGALHFCGRFIHSTTHRRIQFHVFAGRSMARRGTWRRLDNLANVPLSSAQRRVLRYFEDQPVTANLRRQ